MIFENYFRKIKKTLPKNPFYMEATSKNHSALDLWGGGGGGGVIVVQEMTTSD